MQYRFRATRSFWRSFAKLPLQKQARARDTFRIFRQNPFDSRLRTHRIHKLSARYGQTIYAVEIEADLRAVFLLKGDTVVTLDIGSHDVYRG
ncbi:hypothetical protein BH20VER1_BH20VER1_18340 [soil metagenome]|jgi:hypothetical protein